MIAAPLLTWPGQQRALTDKKGDRPENTLPWGSNVARRRRRDVPALVVPALAHSRSIMIYYHGLNRSSDF
jgi:hypothetical protein